MKQTKILPKDNLFVRLTLFILIAVVLDLTEAYGQKIVKEEAFEITIYPGWERLKNLPQGFDVGFQKPGNNGNITFLFHYELMPPEAGEPPSNTSDMLSQWNVMVENQYPDAKVLTSSSPKVNGRILINAAYDLTDLGKLVRRRYTYFLSGRTVFLVQCTAQPAEWQQSLSEFDLMIASLIAIKSETKKVISDAEASSRVKRDIPTLLASFPSQWSVELGSTDILNNEKRILDINLKFYRKDISEIYNSTKYLFTAIKQGKSDEDLQNMPEEIRKGAEESSAFIKYVGQVWGAAFGFVADCEPPIREFRIGIITSEGTRIGAISISRENAAAILSGKVDASQEQQLASMFHFE